MEITITKDDLRQFRFLLLNDIEQLLKDQKENSTEEVIIDSEWLRSKSIRQFLDISPGTLQNLRISGKIEFKKIMGSYYYKKSDLIALFKK